MTDSSTKSCTDTVICDVSDIIINYIKNIYRCMYVKT